MTGTISTEIGNLVDLRFLQLDFNEFTGTVPSELANAQDLGKFQISLANRNVTDEYFC